MILKSTTTVPSIQKATKATGILTTHRLDSDLFIAAGAGPSAGRGRGGRARGREQTVWSDNLVDPPAVRYRNATTTGVKDSDECRGMSPLALFTLFFTDYLLRDIVTSPRQIAMPNSAWPSLQSVEMRICPGLNQLCLSCDRGWGSSLPWVLSRREDGCQITGKRTPTRPLLPSAERCCVSVSCTFYNFFTSSTTRMLRSTRRSALGRSRRY